MIDINEYVWEGLYVLKDVYDLPDRIAADVKLCCDITFRRNLIIKLQLPRQDLVGKILKYIFIGFLVICFFCSHHSPFRVIVLRLNHSYHYN